jgi:hypothetical protein
MNMTARERDRRSRFDDIFRDPFFGNRFPGFSRGRPLTVTTEPVTLNVRPLPEKGKPPDFSGLVGSFHMDAKLAPDTVTAGESATLTVTVGGWGNANRIPDVRLPDIPGTRTYSDQPTLTEDQNDRGMGGTKTMKWAVVPEKAGRLDIPSLSVSYFDPRAEVYKVLRTPTRTLEVLPGGPKETPTLLKSGSMGGPARQNEIQQIGQDILPIHTTAVDLSAPAPDQSLLDRWRLWAAAAAPPAVYLMLLGGVRFSRRSPERSAQQRSKQAFRVLAKRCRRDNADNAALIDALTAYVNDRFGLCIGTLTSDDARDLFRAKGAGPHSVDRLHDWLRRLETAVYTGTVGSRPDSAEGLLAIVKTLEKEIR